MLDAATEADGAFEFSITRGGRAVAGAELRVYLRGPDDPNTGEAMWREAGTAVCDATGRARLFARTGLYLIVARLDGRVIAHAEALRPRGEPLTRVLLVATEPAEVRGTVLLRGSREPVPLAELVLTWLPQPGAPASAPEQEGFFTTADARGRFAFAAVPAGRYALRASSVGAGSGGSPPWRSLFRARWRSSSVARLR